MGGFCVGSEERDSLVGTDVSQGSTTTLELYSWMYPVRDNHPSHVVRRCRPRAMGGSMPTSFAWALGVLLLICGGVTYRVVASRLKLVVGTAVTLPMPLDCLPREVGHWVGEDVPIPANIQRVAGNDAFVNRLYTNRVSRQWANVYIAYTAHPRTMLGHRPQVCYVAAGWVHDRTDEGTLVSERGRKIPCLVHYFHRYAPDREETAVLSFYIVNGQLTCDESVFSGVGWRTPNISGDPAHYVAQVQISSALENSARAAAECIAEPVLDLLPDPDGKVRAAGHVEVRDEQVK